VTNIKILIIAIIAFFSTMASAGWFTSRISDRKEILVSDASSCIVMMAGSKNQTELRGHRASLNKCVLAIAVIDAKRRGQKTVGVILPKYKSVIDAENYGTNFVESLRALGITWPKGLPRYATERENASAIIQSVSSGLRTSPLTDMEKARLEMYMGVIATIGNSVRDIERDPSFVRPEIITSLHISPQSAISSMLSQMPTGMVYQASSLILYPMDQKQYQTPLLQAIPSVAPTVSSDALAATPAIVNLSTSTPSVIGTSSLSQMVANRNESDTFVSTIVNLSTSTPSVIGTSSLSQMVTNRNESDTIVSTINMLRQLSVAPNDLVSHQQVSNLIQHAISLGVVQVLSSMSNTSLSISGHGSQQVEQQAAISGMVYMAHAARLEEVSGHTNDAIGSISQLQKEQLGQDAISKILQVLVVSPMDTGVQRQVGISTTKGVESISPQIVMYSPAISAALASEHLSSGLISSQNMIHAMSAIGVPAGTDMNSALMYMAFAYSAAINVQLAVSVNDAIKSGLPICLAGVPSDLSWRPSMTPLQQADFGTMMSGWLQSIMPNVKAIDPATVQVLLSYSNAVPYVKVTMQPMAGNVGAMTVTAPQWMLQSVSNIPMIMSAASQINHMVEPGAISAKPYVMQQQQVSIFSNYIALVSGLKESSGKISGYWPVVISKSDTNADAWYDKTIVCTNISKIAKRQMGSIFIYGEAIPTPAGEKASRQEDAIKKAVGMGYNCILVAYYGGAGTNDVARLISFIHGCGAKVLFAVSVAGYDGNFIGYSVDELGAVLDVAARRSDYFMASWRGSSPHLMRRCGSFMASIVNMAVKRNPYICVFGISTIHEGDVFSFVPSGSSAIILAAPVSSEDSANRLVVNKKAMAARFGFPDTEMILGPVCFPAPYQPQDRKKVMDISKSILDTKTSFFRLHGNGDRITDAMTLGVLDD
jgi:hypothetical protein